jgi:hypothetical protein
MVPADMPARLRKSSGIVVVPLLVTLVSVFICMNHTNKSITHQAAQSSAGKLTLPVRCHSLRSSYAGLGVI